MANSNRVDPNSVLARARAHFFYLKKKDDRLNGDVDSSVDLIRKQGAHEDDVEFMTYVYDSLS
jgi:hypothetical protein